MIRYAIMALGAALCAAAPAGAAEPQTVVADAAKKYGVTYAKVANPSGGYSVDHTAGIFLMGPDGTFVKRFSYDISAKELAASILEMLRSQTQ